MEIFLDRFPSIDLHGFDRESARVAVCDFIEYNLILKNSTVVIIHGIGSGIVKNMVHEVLKKNKNVLEFGTHNFNPGVTVVKLKISLE